MKKFYSLLVVLSALMVNAFGGSERYYHRDKREENGQVLFVHSLRCRSSKKSKQTNSLQKERREKEKKASSKRKEERKNKINK